MNNTIPPQLKRLKLIYKSTNPARSADKTWILLNNRLDNQNSPRSRKHMQYSFAFASLVLIVLLMATTAINASQNGELLYPIKVAGQNAIKKIFNNTITSPDTKNQNNDESVRIVNQSALPPAELQPTASPTPTTNQSISPTQDIERESTKDNTETKGVGTEKNKSDEHQFGTEKLINDSLSGVSVNPIVIDDKKKDENQDTKEASEKSKKQKNDSEKKESFWKKLFRKSK